MSYLKSNMCDSVSPYFLSDLASIISTSHTHIRFKLNYPWGVISWLDFFLWLTSSFKIMWTAKRSASLLYKRSLEVFRILLEVSLCCLSDPWLCSNEGLWWFSMMEITWDLFYSFKSVSVIKFVNCNYKFFLDGFLFCFT